MAVERLGVPSCGPSWLQGCYMGHSSLILIDSEISIYSLKIYVKILHINIYPYTKSVNCYGNCGQHHNHSGNLWFKIRLQSTNWLYPYDYCHRKVILPAITRICSIYSRVVMILAICMHVCALCRPTHLSWHLVSCLKVQCSKEVARHQRSMQLTTAEQRLWMPACMWLHIIYNLQYDYVY